MDSISNWHSPKGEIELRLEIMKLLAQIRQGSNSNYEILIMNADEIYEWIIQAYKTENETELHS